AILKKPSVFLFDEATSALDSRTEKDIQHALDEVSENQTTLMIAHRLSTIIHADEIIVLSDGEVVERGTHQHLMRQQGLYNAMWQRQSSGFADTTTSAAPATGSLLPDSAAS
ncbi:metal ABC transporter permease, partial [Alphaproteobacteria bacterium]|nr:metal ABC transporter permease [Alphaproteobacteria bacterium]